MKCLLIYFSILLLQPLTVEIIVEQDLEDDDFLEENNIESEPKRKYKRMYRKEWETDPRLKSNLCHSCYLNYNVAYTYLSLLLKLNNIKN